MKKALIEGSSKQFFPLDNGHYLMSFKDNIHGASQESTIVETGSLRKEFTFYFYRLLEIKGISTHLAPGGDEALTNEGIIVQPCRPIKMEILVRNIARGHWVDEHKIPLFEGGTPFDEPIVEFCLKMKKTLPDGRVLDDPRITPQIAIALQNHAKDPEIRGHMIHDLHEGEKLVTFARRINAEYSLFMAKQGWTLEDFKFEVGLSPENRVVLIDEISPDSSRIRDSSGRSLTKDLFRQRRPDIEIVEGYKRLRDIMKNAYKESLHTCLKH